MTTQQTIAQQILAQLGGNKFLAMTGAKDLLAGSNCLNFTLPKLGKNRMNVVRITLQTSDTYMIEFFSRRGLNVKSGEFIRDVYAEQLREIFEDRTGYYTSL